MKSTRRDVGGLGLGMINHVFLNSHDCGDGSRSATEAKDSRTLRRPLAESVRQQLRCMRKYIRKIFSSTRCKIQTRIVVRTFVSRRFHEVRRDSSGRCVLNLPRVFFLRLRNIPPFTIVYESMIDLHNVQTSRSPGFPILLSRCGYGWYDALQVVCM